MPLSFQSKFILDILTNKCLGSLALQFYLDFSREMEVISLFVKTSSTLKVLHRNKLGLRYEEWKIFELHKKFNQKTPS